MFGRESRLSKGTPKSITKGAPCGDLSPSMLKDTRQTPAKPSAGPRSQRRESSSLRESLIGHTPSRGHSRNASKTSSPRTPSEQSDMEALDSCRPRSPPSADNIQVVVRVKPLGEDSQTGSLQIVSPSSVGMSTSYGPRTWTFDHIAGPETSQEAFFAVAGEPFVEHCLEGFHASIFAYGQTSSGKTHTMTGKPDSPRQMGLAMRVIQRLFQRIAASEDLQGTQKYQLKASYLELYDEQIADLLAARSAAQLTVREDVCKDSARVYVDGLTEVELLNVHDAQKMMERGLARRRTNETRMNAESSRSHAVLTLHLESSTRTDLGLLAVKSSRLNLVDLAGSERNKGSGAVGERLKEACSINQSLTTLGRVIKELVEAQQSRQSRHIPYRDSRLTFLLQESLGGNAKTLIIANVSPAQEHCSETGSTLAFAARAKCIRNSAVINQDMRGDTELMRRELARLQRENDMLRQHMSKSSEAPEAITHERSASADERETLREAQQRSEQLAAELAQEISRGEQERILAERRIQHLESSSSSTRQELNAARLAGIAERQNDDRQISSLKAQVKEQGLQIAALEGSLAHAKQSALEERRQMQQQIAALQQELQDADLAASVAQEQLTHERQRTGRLKQAIKSAFEDARTPAAGLAGHGWRSDLSIAGKENANSPDSHSPARRPFEGLRVNVEL
ncbi:g6937 [Coccomyxa viridis]|uniref:Kinesin-like protein n=1 Tax=Coccomyxa viridis TaxID=1274662 RepID=A0ABP1FWJ9_9CHLO